MNDEVDFKAIVYDHWLAYLDDCDKWEREPDIKLFEQWEYVNYGEGDV